MKRAARAAALLLVISLAISIFPVAAQASSPANCEKSVDLGILGLFGDLEKGYDLTRPATRAEGAVMLVRLMGAEKEALQSKYKHPFTDIPAWADAYVGYMYHMNFIADDANGKFNPDLQLAASDYVMYVLKALGYDGGTNGFLNGEAFDEAVRLGLVTADCASSLKSGRSLLMDDIAGISYNALNVKIKNSSKTLLDKLVYDDRAVFKPAATRLGLYTSDLAADMGNLDSFMPASAENGYKAENSGDLFLIWRRVLYQCQQSFIVDASGYRGDLKQDFKAAFNKAYWIVNQLTGIDNSVKWSYTGINDVLTVTAKYGLSKNSYDEKKEKSKKALNKARQLVSSLIKKGMTAFEKEKVLHDYIIDHTRYDITGYNSGKIDDDSYTEYGCFLNGLAVCQGYSESMKLLCDLSGIECLTVSGSANDRGSWGDHAWNMVRIDGDWYHLDLTFDDPVMEDGEDVLSYNYFNLNDSEVKNIYSWERSPGIPACSGVKNGYYFRNNMIAGNCKEFTTAVVKAVESRKSAIELKVRDYSFERYSDTNLKKIVFSTKAVRSYKYMIDKSFGIIRIYNIKYS